MSFYRREVLEVGGGLESARYARTLGMIAQLFQNPGEVLIRSDQVVHNIGDVGFPPLCQLRHEQEIVGIQVDRQTVLGILAIKLPPLPLGEVMFLSHRFAPHIASVSTLSPFGLKIIVTQPSLKIIITYDKYIW